MAMVKCKNCDNEVMNTAVLCSSCGSPQANTQSKIVRYGGGFLLLMALLAWLSSVIGGNKKLQDDLPAKVETRSLEQFKAPPVINKIKPESLVVFPKSGLACLEREALQKAMEHAIKGEETKMLAMMINPKTGRGQCIMLSTTKRYKVISSEYNSDDIDLGLLELVGEGNMSGNGAWAFTAGAEVVK